MISLWAESNLQEPVDAAIRAAAAAKKIAETMHLNAFTPLRASPKPNAWNIRSLTIAGALMGIGELLFCTAILAYGKYASHMDLNTLRTLAFVTVVFGNQATTFNNRERRYLWSSRPSNWVLAIQEPALGIWGGEKTHRSAAQQSLPHRARCSGAASQGAYSPAMKVT
jgi:hypothetical protein